MHPIIRSALVLLAGVIVAVCVVTLLDGLAGRIFPLPAGVDTRDPESLRRAVAALPTTAFMLLLTGWVLAAAVGAYVAARLATYARANHGMIVAGFVLIATVANLAAITHPVWMWPAVIILIPAAGWAATKLVVRPARI